MTDTEPSLADLAAASGIEARTIRSWVAQGILPAPLTRGPAARYPADTLQRVLAVRAMRDLMGMPLSEIRKELLVATPEQIRSHAERAATLTQGAATLDLREQNRTVSSALDYIGELRAKTSPAPRMVAQSSVSAPLRGFDALEQSLGQGRVEPARKSRAEEWLRIPITPDVELAVRAPLDPHQTARLERCADLIRDILLGRDK